jgi:hypothetical protein
MKGDSSDDELCLLYFVAAPSGEFMLSQVAKVGAQNLRLVISYLQLGSISTRLVHSRPPGELAATAQETQEAI